LPPVFAYIVEESEDCRAALAKADTFNPCNIDAASYDSASQRMSKFFYVYILQSEIEPNISILG
jgi:hypothetical protein